MNIFCICIVFCISWMAGGCCYYCYCYCSQNGEGWSCVCATVIMMLLLPLLLSRGGCVVVGSDEVVLDTEDDIDVVVDVGADISVFVGSVGDVHSICLFWVMVRWHLLPSCLFHLCNVFFRRDLCCCRCHCCCSVIIVVVIVVGFVVVHDRCHFVT